MVSNALLVTRVDRFDPIRSTSSSGQQMDIWWSGGTRGRFQQQKMLFIAALVCFAFLRFGVEFPIPLVHPYSTTEFE